MELLLRTFDRLGRRGWVLSWIKFWLEVMKQGVKLSEGIG